MRDLVGAFLSVLVVIAAWCASIAIGASQPDTQGCATVQNMNGWQSCRLLDRKFVLVGLRGCAKNDGHAYEVAGTNAAGRSVQALVCCGTLFKGCTVRAP